VIYVNVKALCDLPLWVFALLRLKTHDVAIDYGISVSEKSRDRERDREGERRREREREREGERGRASKHIYSIYTQRLDLPLYLGDF